MGTPVTSLFSKGFSAWLFSPCGLRALCAMVTMMAKRRVNNELGDDDAKLLDNLIGDACAKQRKAVTISDVVRAALRQSATKAGMTKRRS